MTGSATKQSMLPREVLWIASAFAL